MGAYVDLKINKLSLLGWKSFFDSKTLGLFFSDDNLIIDDVEVDGELRKKFKYTTTVRAASDRLDSIGYTIKRFEQEFNSKKYQALDYSKYLYDKDVDFEKQEEVIKTRVDKYITIKKWKNSIRKYSEFLLKNDIFDFLLRDKKIPQELNPKNESDRIVYNSIFGVSGESFFGCYYDEFDCINTIRFILDKCGKEDLLEIDITEMVGWTYGSIEEMMIGDPTPKTIVLVEGTNDKNILEFALKNIYPHLFNLYYFMDFEFGRVKKRPGGNDSVINNMKAFVYSKLKAKFIAIFDNDTIGCFSKEKLINEIGELPSNCKVLTYPNIDIAKKYPTILPNGKIILDNINGRACSIELYLPSFILKENDVLPNVEWNSIQKIDIGGNSQIAYQGVIVNKTQVEKRFKEYKKLIDNGEKTFNVDEWGNMRMLLDELLFVFNK